MHETTTLLLVTLPNIHPLKKFTDRLGNKPFLIWLLTTPSHLKYVTTLPCNLSLMTCFADVDVSQGSVATYARCGGSLKNIHLTTNLPGNFAAKNIFNRFRFDRIMVMSLWPHFLAYRVIRLEMGYSRPTGKISRHCYALSLLTLSDR